MKLLQLATAALLPFTALAAKKPSTDRFQTYNSKQLSNAGPVKLDDKAYNGLTKTPRDYSVAVLLTALEARFGCNLCNEFQPEWELLAKQWTKGDKKGEGRLVFGTLDFTDGKATFQSLMLQTAPVLLLFPPTTGPNAKPDNIPHRFDFSSGTNTAEPIHAFLTRHLPSIPHPPFTRPINYLRIAILTTTTLGALTFLTIAAPYILPIIQNRNLWAAISLIAVLLFTSGHMFNHIRKVPYVGGDGKGQISYFAGGFQNQFGLETQIVAAMYGILSFATISLALKVPRMTDARNQQIAVFVWGAVILGMYSFLLSVFRIKNGGYPFWLPPF
ncbi:oligosaccharyl transferase subunit ost3/OST6 [Elasticomyces elasticus]|nr:oligosaccharyl transferase subunit ost3/OST6 [Elasticomyces elasticus]KAK3637428.1 oligosaccharyl transferase subunit ost3/OST6 [Elasticomyces elasticus]KAK4917912.1 oligosaccharyl transferase subunit ost3/OST6 [Elasticomyces elasticus]KAK5757071.1 oligosaccharyl transferase subunit ost3/OST6 [Elasticomyces elasticus]